MAKPLIKTRFQICYAITYLKVTKQITFQEANLAKTYVKSLLGYCSTVLAWLWYKGVIPFGERTNYDLELIDYRERWIDHMIQELSK